VGVALLTYIPARAACRLASDPSCRYAAYRVFGT